MQTKKADEFEDHLTNTNIHVRDNKIQSISVISNNQFNKNNVKLGYALRSSAGQDGQEIPNETYFISDYISCVPATVYSSNMVYFTAYDSNYNIISPVIKADSKITTPENTVYVRASGSIANLGIYKFGLGEMLPKDEYITKIDGLVSDVEANGIIKTNIDDNAVTDTKNTINFNHKR